MEIVHLPNFYLEHFGQLHFMQRVNYFELNMKNILWQNNKKYEKKILIFQM